MKKIVLFAALVGLLFTACKKKADDSNSQELITTVKLTFTDKTSGEIKSFQWEDLDGDGSASPVIDKIKLAENRSFDVKIEFTDKSKTPIVNTTDEVFAERDVHLVTFKLTGSTLVFAYADVDSNGKPVGLTDTATTGATSSGVLNLVLHHEPTSKDNLADPGGETDVDVTFPVDIQ